MRRLIMLVAVAAAAMAIAGCGDSDDGGPTNTTTASFVDRDVTVTISGRTIVGHCTGPQTDAPTVVLEVGMGAPRTELDSIGTRFVQRTQVCTYDRAGKGQSAPATTPRPVADVITDLHAFLGAVAKPPYFLVGQSFGAEVVFRYAQAHPDQVAGFISMNPSPPYKTWVKRAATVETPAELREFELLWFRGENEEGIDTRSDERMLTDPLPADLPYVVMFDEACDGLPPPLQNQRDCTRMVHLLELTAKDLAEVGKGGRYVRVKGGGHRLYVARLDDVMTSVEQVWSEAAAR
jgi:pimeloyl-ACP methyl ester carboxylesterase